LLVLHGEATGAGRGGVQQVAERFGRPPIPASDGRETPSGWRASATSPASIWFIDAAGLGRPHLLGPPSGAGPPPDDGDEPRSIDRLVWWRRSVSSRDGEIPTSSTIAGAAPQHDHLRRAIPEWDALFGRPLAPAEAELAGATGNDGAAHVEAVHAQSPAPRFLPRVANPTLSWGREDRIVPVGCGEQYRRLLPNAALTVLERCGHLPPIEQPDAFARLVTDFLGGPPRP
jgi:pimeloyl-ACP methyl ester carboxylesterase